MRLYAKAYLILFLGAGIPYGIAMGVCFSVTDGLRVGLEVAAIGGTLFGGAMTLVGHFLRSLTVRRIASGKSKKVVAVQHVRNTELEMPYDKAFDLCLWSLHLINMCKVRKEDRAAGRIYARAGRLWNGLGEVSVISFVVDKTDTGRTQVIVTSRPPIAGMIADSDKNLENVEAIAGFLRDSGRLE